MKQQIALVSGLLVVSLSHAQTCKDNIPRTAPNSRYELLSDGSEVKDKQTGLVWQRCSLGQIWNGSTCDGNVTIYTWKAALKAAKDLGNGYHLPNIKELQTLVEEACYSPAINETYFPNTTTGAWYWSSSPNIYSNVNSWSVGFNVGTLGGYYGGKGYNNVARAVRISQ